MDKLRMRFRKEGRAVYISHLDLMHTMQRAFTRTEYNLKHSEGFNPHPIMSILLPLSVGTSSCCEIMDFRLLEDTEFTAAEFEEMKDKLNTSLPEGIRVDEIYPVNEKATDLKWLKVLGRFEYDSSNAPLQEGVISEDDRQPSLEDIADKLKEFFSQNSIIIKKKTKSGVNDFDVKSGIRSFKFYTGDHAINLEAIVSAQEPTFNPELIPEALRQLSPDLVPSFTAFSRVKIYDRGMNIFR